jgi:hypothetical protein
VKLDGSLASVWGSTPEERRTRFPCERYLSGIDGEYFRATAVGAPPAVLFRWLCQLKVAPYSYDLIDNFGHRSPKELIPGVENLARGQKLMSIFELVDFQRDRHLTVTMSDQRAISIFGHIALSYVVLPSSDDSCRLVAKMPVRYSRRAP